ncbi:MAG: 4-hydroxy-3-methylbut-2-enyl diphosphate reductase [Gammaproteobacteria bacterium]
MIVETAVRLANPRGFCAGVERAIAIVESVLTKRGAPVYVKHEIVHNRAVVEDFRRRGVVFIEDPADAPPGAVLIFSAHGVSRAVRDMSAARGLEVIDATCPLVTKVHAEVSRLRAAGYEIIMIGHRGHPEVEGTLGQADGGVYLVEREADIGALKVADPARLALVTQTTLSVDDTAKLSGLLRAKFPDIRTPRRDDICYATQNRQDAVKKMAAECEVVLVIGSRASSNSNRLREVAELCGARAYLIDGAGDVNADWLRNATHIGVTAGASAPERLVREIVEWLRSRFGAKVYELPGVEEKVVFAMPKSLAHNKH